MQYPRLEEKKSNGHSRAIAWLAKSKRYLVWLKARIVTWVGNINFTKFRFTSIARSSVYCQVKDFGVLSTKLLNKNWVGMYRYSVCHMWVSEWNVCVCLNCIVCVCLCAVCMSCVVKCVMKCEVKCGVCVCVSVSVCLCVSCVWFLHVRVNEDSHGPDETHQWSQRTQYNNMSYTLWTIH